VRSHDSRLSSVLQLCDGCIRRENRSWRLKWQADPDGSQLAGAGSPVIVASEAPIEDVILRARRHPRIPHTVRDDA
jgi:hypothetical protein